PNNDNVNDGFGLRGLYIAQFHLEIYNMWGQKVFSTDKCMEDWDCTVDGEPAQDGTYFYVVHATGADSVRHNMKGTIHLIR
ncbi:MAG: gliding motility-associated C-terminal domain-containing protein, partial [Bacteroidia bacterium]